MPLVTKTMSMVNEFLDESRIGPFWDQNKQNMNKERRYDLDWIRVLVFDALIFFHVGMFFVTWGWHIKNNVIVETLEFPMMLLNQWRLPILFVISGMGTRFALGYRSAGQFIGERFKRLFIPLLAGILLIVPPQVYLERVTQSVPYANYLDFYFWDFFKGVYPSGNFSWHHLWFLPYLLTYSILLTPLFIFWRNQSEASWLKRVQQFLLKYPFAIYGLTVPLMLVYYFLAPYYPTTHALIGDWYTLAFYGLFFVYGFFLIMIKDVLWELLKKVRKPAIFLIVICFTVFYLLVEMGGPLWLKAIFKMVNIWSWILMIFGYAAKYLNRPSALLSYRNRAVYPYYILHQTITIMIGFYLMNNPMHWGLKFIIMVVGTFAGSALIYEFIIKRVKFIGLLFGVKPIKKASNDGSV